MAPPPGVPVVAEVPPPVVGVVLAGVVVAGVVVAAVLVADELVAAVMEPLSADPVAPIAEVEPLELEFEAPSLS